MCCMYSMTIIFTRASNLNRYYNIDRAGNVCPHHSHHDLFIDVVRNDRDRFMVVHHRVQFTHGTRAHIWLPR